MTSTFVSSSLVGILVQQSTCTYSVTQVMFNVSWTTLRYNNIYLLWSCLRTPKDGGDSLPCLHCNANFRPKILIIAS